uniref:NADH-ubiquinone oxidoreductase chain 6 n=1 Tax=Tenebrionoidea sp. 9 KM-2017 TaxID=2219487 RepID=A0A346RKH1_9CUCU|nr:NADH dehydrogenase subunit 6 [Tenebrionoidea sp. 9 KM-2017]
MLMIILSINLMMSMIFLSLTHPLSMGLILLIQTLTISLITGNLSLNFWFSYIIFLVLIGGMLVLFIYMTSVASNEKFEWNLKIIPMMMSSLVLMLTVNLYYTNIKSINMMTKNFKINEQINISMIKYINFPSSMILIFMIIYLLITLIAVVKITDISNGPLRQKN